MGLLPRKRRAVVDVVGVAAPAVVDAGAPAAADAAPAVVEAGAPAAADAAPAAATADAAPVVVDNVEFEGIRALSAYDDQ